MNKNDHYNAYFSKVLNTELTTDARYFNLVTKLVTWKS